MNILQLLDHCSALLVACEHSDTTNADLKHQAGVLGRACATAAQEIEKEVEKKRQKQWTKGRKKA